MTKWPPIILAMIFLSITACQQDEKEKDSESKKAKPTEQTKQDTSVMTAEMLWKLDRISDMQVSPDKKQVLFGVKRYK